MLTVFTLKTLVTLSCMENTLETASTLETQLCIILLTVTSSWPENNLESVSTPETLLTLSCTEITSKTNYTLENLLCNTFLTAPPS